jgi:ABC-type multidrug transport system fused ATPase/permease subunit
VETLEDPVTEGGNNFSVGQRQLLVIARALLNGSRIVVMDEATASVDAETDSIITETMRREFSNATVITVAHRLNTIMDSDYILVMSDGVASEFDTPKNLIGKGGLFRELVRAAARE